ncbi:thioredoxin domain-containing protein [Bacillus solimangrovi]|uniref:Thioredoxin domain-containing protein n=1 Tax=Bacillus solimangrovi TaxID=1305675 RepID=A0A1E5LII5_9BACI|nr:thioredoxin domain-containing protein [Bacillus solimangrovi]OEH93885.1 hypothetical protein BFG57_10455 [Bacillus solimangrovi]
MKQVFTLLVLTFVLGACQTVDGNSIDDINQNDKGYQVIFFSNEDYLEYEGNYYDVLLDLKKQYPKETVNIIIVQSSSNNKLVEHFNVEEYPTLIIQKDGEIISTLAGVYDKEIIYESILNVINE